MSRQARALARLARERPGELSGQPVGGRSRTQRNGLAVSEQVAGGAMEVREHFAEIAAEMQARFNQSASIRHRGDAGENREEILRSFLNEYLPQRFAAAKGEIVTQHGDHSHAADIIIYDRLNCPVLY